MPRYLAKNRLLRTDTPPRKDILMDNSTENIINEGNNIPPKKRKPKYVGFSFKERLLPTILLSIAIPAITVLFGTFELYYANMSEFLFSLSDFFSFCILISIGIAAIIFLSLIFLRGRVFDIAYAILAFVAFMLMIQGNYLSSGVITGFIGDGNMEEISLALKLINLAVWIIIGAGFVLAVILVRNREIIKTVITILMITLIGMPLVNFGVVSISSDVYTPVEQRENDNTDTNEKKILTSKYITEISENKNVIYFLVDRFDARYAEKTMEEMPELFSELEGFTYYSDNISLYPRTYPSVVYMLTGQRQDFTNSRKDFFASAYKTAPGLNLLSDNNYKVNIYTDSYYAYDDASVMSEYAANLSGVTGREVVNTFDLAVNMIRGSLFFRVPFVLNAAVGSSLSTPLFAKYVIFESDYPQHDIDNKNIYDTLTKSDYSTNSDSNTFSFIHMTGSHLPNLYDENWNEIDSDHESAWDECLAIKVSMESINAYLRQMKEMGVYEDATIIITGDHAAPHSDTKELSGTRRTALFIKKSGDSTSPLTVSKKQVCQDNLWATIIESEGIETEIDFGRSVFDIADGETIRREYFFQRMDDGFFENITYYVNGDSSDFDNWEIVNRVNIEGSVHK